MDLFVRCEKCRNHIEPGDLFCTNCGHEAEAREGEVHRSGATMEAYRFDCSGCGATMTWDIETQGLRCAFCGQETLVRQEKKATIPRPSHVAPFEADRDKASQIFRDWVGKGFFRPSDVRKASAITEMRGVYLPYYAFEAECETYWAADSNATPSWARASWAPYFGEHRAAYSGVLVPASGALALDEVRAIEPYDLGRAVPYDEDQLGDRPAEAFAVTSRRAQRLARGALEGLELGACAGLVPGTSHRNLKVNAMISGLAAIHALLPVWIMAYTYGKKRYRFLVNGQTGKGTGTAPVSIWKVLLVVLLILLGILVLGGILAVASR